MNNLDALREFAHYVLVGALNGYSIDGGEAQDKAVELGLLVTVTMTEPCGVGCNCVAYGEFPLTCYRLALGDEQTEAA